MKEDMSTIDPMDCDGRLLQSFREQIAEEKRQVKTFWYRKGLREGLTRFAWWKDGVQYVGTCGTTLKQALEEVDREFLDVQNIEKQ